jgi:hypothetical protein
MRLTDERLCELRRFADITKHPTMTDLLDTIEALQQERDAAIADIKRALSLNGGCPICKHWNKANPKLSWCNKNSACEFEWRGLEVE